MGNNRKSSYFVDKILIPLIVGIITTVVASLITYRVTALNIEQATVDMMAKRLKIVEEKDTLEEAVNNISKELEQKEKDISSLNDEITELQTQLSDDKKDIEIQKLNNTLSEKEQELTNKQSEIDVLQSELNELKEKGYEEYVKSKQGNYGVSLKYINAMKNEGVRIDNTASESVDGTPFNFFIDTVNSGESYIEYQLDAKYSEFCGTPFISKWAYKNFDASDSRITTATIVFEAKYTDGDEYKVIDSISGLVADSKPEQKRVNLIGVTRLKIIFRGGGCHYDWTDESIIRLGTPELFEITSQ